MKTYDVTVTREGRWWMVSVPEIDGLTQARRLSEVGQMARELIALEEDLALSDVEVNVTEVDVAGLDVHETGELVAQLRGEVRQLEDTIASITAATARVLVDENVPMRDIAEVIGVSHQRVAQITGGMHRDLKTGTWLLTIQSFNDLFGERQAKIAAAIAPLARQQFEIQKKLAPLFETVERTQRAVTASSPKKKV